MRLSTQEVPLKGLTDGARACRNNQPKIRDRYSDSRAAGFFDAEFRQHCASYAVGWPHWAPGRDSPVVIAKQSCSALVANFSGLHFSSSMFELLCQVLSQSLKETQRQCDSLNREMVRPPP